MNPETNKPPRLRRSPVHLAPLDLPDLNTIIFLTLCSKGRQPVVAQPWVHEALLAAWHEADRWRVGRYIILPDHVHLFCAPAQLPTEGLANWVTYWKRTFSRKIQPVLPDFCWQASFWDKQLKRGESYATKWEYVRAHAVRHGLVKELEDWPYQGEMEVLHGDA